MREIIPKIKFKTNPQFSFFKFKATGYCMAIVMPPYISTIAQLSTMK